MATLEGHSKQVRSDAFSPDGRRIVCGSEDNSVRVWDARLGGHSDGVRSVADGRRIVYGSGDKSLRDIGPKFMLESAFGGCYLD